MVKIVSFSMARKSHKPPRLYEEKGKEEKEEEERKKQADDFLTQ
jgi:hypothetical protein